MTDKPNFTSEEADVIAYRAITKALNGVKTDYLLDPKWVNTGVCIEIEIQVNRLLLAHRQDRMARASRGGVDTGATTR